MIKLSFHGACQEVTGSCHLVETDSVKFLVDCGIFQGGDFYASRNWDEFAFDPKEIDFVILTHAHMDHAGRLPKLYKDGFRGKVYCVEPTKDFAYLMLYDSARIAQKEAKSQNRPAPYSRQNVRDLINLFVPLKYDRQIKINSKLRFKLRDAGHILGSAIAEVWIKDGSQEKKLVFSGDLGNSPVPLLKDTSVIDGADYVVMEATYGGRIHEPAELRLRMLKEAIIQSVGQKGVLMIPSFALERTQEVLYELNYLIENRLVPDTRVFLDSPLAIRATKIYQDYLHYFDKESQKLMQAGDDIFQFPGLEFTSSSRQSKRINGIQPPKVIIAGSGMCVGGRIPFHLKLYLNDPNNQLLFIGYQVDGSLGRKLFDGAKQVKILGEQVRVKAKIDAIGAYSAHADQPKLLHWVKMMTRPKPKQVFVVHGEEEPALMIKDGLKQKLGIEGVIPEYGQKYTV